MSNKEEDIRFEYLCESEKNNLESEQQQKQEAKNLVRIGAGDINTYANITLRYMEEHGSAVIAARGNRCGKAIMVYQLLWNMEFISTVEGPLLSIGEDQLDATKTDNVVTQIPSIGIPFIRITVFPRKRYILFPRKPLTDPVSHA